MKPTLIVAIVAFAATCLPVSLLAQKDKDIPAWGKVEKADLQMKACAFDKDAEAVVLLDVGELVFLNGDIELEKRVRIKILKEGGLEKADVKIPYYYYKSLQSIGKLSAQTYNLDASGNIVTTAVDKKSIFDKKINKRVAEITFSCPEVKPGSIIEYKYILRGADLVTWYFQSDIPVQLSRFRTDFPLEVELSNTPFCVLPYDHQKELKGNRDVQTVTMKEVPALRDEPFISNDEDYLQRVQTRLVAVTNPNNGQRIRNIWNWVQVVKLLMEDEDFGQQLKKEIPRTADLDAELKTIKDPYLRMKTIHHYVRKNMAWNEYTGIWAFDGVKSAWKEKKGTLGEINLILVNLLKDAGLAASPILVSTRDNGRVSTMLPDYNQFNKVLAQVKIGDKVYILDATDKNTPTHLYPRDLMYTEALVIEKIDTYEWGWTAIWDETMLKKKMVIMRADITDKDSLVGEAHVSSMGYDRLDRQSSLTDGKDKLLSRYFTDPHPNVRVDEFDIENQDSDSLPLVQKLKFAQPVTASGDYKFFTANLFTGLERNPFLAENRFSDVFFGINQNVTVIANFKIPEGYAFEELPKSIRMIMPDTSIEITRRVVAENNQLSVRINLDFKKPFYSTEEYDYFMQFYKQLFDMLNEQIVYRKKVAPLPKP